MNKFAVTLFMALVLWLLPAATSHADGGRMHGGGRGVIVVPRYYYGGYPGNYSFYSPSWYYFQRPHYYYGRAGYGRYRGRRH